MKYEQPFDQPSTPDASYVNGDAANSVQGSIPPAAVFENPQREIIAAIMAAGFTPADTDLSQLLRSVRSGILEFHLDTGAADAMVIACSPPVAAITNGMRFCVGKLGADNATTTPTLTVDGIIQTIVKADGTPVAPGDLGGSARFTVRSDGTSFRLEGNVVASDIMSVNWAIHHAIDTSVSASTIVATMVPAITAYGSNHLYILGVGHDCTGPTQVNFSGLGLRTLLRFDGSPCVVGDWSAGSRLSMIYDGTYLKLTGITVPHVASIVSQTINNSPSLQPARHLAVDQTTGGNYTYLVPDGIDWLFVELVGAGGGGGGGAGGVGWCSGGGGAGGTAAFWMAVTPGQTINYTVGTNGAGSSNAAGAVGVTGGTTSFGSSYATGGQGGASNVGGSCRGGSPGYGFGPGKNTFGGIGGDGNPGNSQVQGGPGGTSSRGGGGRTSTVNPATYGGINQINGLAPGSGGGGIWGGSGAGAASAQTGGSGADGSVTISY